MERLKKLIQKLFIVYLVAGALLLAVDSLAKKERSPYLRVSFYEPAYDTVFVEDKERIERIKESFERYVGLKRVKWFLPPSTDCIVYVTDEDRDILYRLCRDKEEKGRWWVAKEGSYKGRSTSNYYELTEEEAKELLRKVREIAERRLR